MAGQPLRVIAVSNRASIGELTISLPAGRPIAGVRTARHGGPPWSIVAEVVPAAEGELRVEARRGDVVLACQQIPVAAAGERTPLVGLRLEWNAATEALYSAWIEHLFDAPPEQSLGFPSLAPVLRDPSRNFLHDHFALGEDGPGKAAIPAEPDCADLPYFLRTYFAWKLGLPTGHRTCGRGGGSTPPRCGPLQVSEPPPPTSAGLAQVKSDIARVQVDAHSASARTALRDDATDLYPVPLTREALRPGTVYADPYGHTLMIARWVPQTAESGGLLLAVDAQPDNSVGRKRFWEGTFLFATDVGNAGPGFKAFRPLVRDGRGAIRSLTNAELANDARFTPFSDQQAGLSSGDFHAAVARVVNPAGLEPERAYEETLAALVEQLVTRVGSVDNGEKYMREKGNPVVAMPEGAAIFQTVGAWEDYATPSRDFRLILAMNVLEGLPAQIALHPELFVLGGRSAGEARAAVEALHARRIGERDFTYTRSDGSSQRLTVADALARKHAFEAAYDPNDCVEVRWGAPPESAEIATCRRRAPAEQRAKMERYRPWFRDGRRPSA